MQDWDPQLYRRFEKERSRPAYELISRIDLSHPQRITDLGCGPGNSTEGLLRRYPGAAITGIDSSDAMLASARQRLPGCRFEPADISHWQPEAPQDVIYANASLQWVPDHQTLLPKLMSYIAPGGALAIQMPDNREEPTHQLMRQLAGQSPWQSVIGDGAQLRVKILGANDYYDLLAPAAHVDLWRTTYFHVMPSVDAIIEWVKSTGLRPFLEPLDDRMRESYLARYRQLLSLAYPVRADGSVILSFPRLFMVAARKNLQY
ncbi:trans-aconitate 2-methyltransferase [Biostraticola tofi]|uniref:Trans-aconitate 2-methyltransferase n=1 Tax=Biostraticola tofi TaxID=466109 RepID=A0A4R3Z3U1_9GAMM|nr:trans-aconitate 2-methyltransferase [Biostraticola tofi]TCV99826.1 trans-aconitate 2-methyltransferase [Biostraticola tofi]